ncbi:FHA domain-containing protein [Tundrisphaera lichenicola]|uniref:FHA domain-containing protein n=1 Tax=Tundrisphaera lichenicola TaxID=2029860 RepID=UPI003EBACAF7
MLGQWRIALKQAEEAARAGRFDEALALASRADVVDHHHAVQLRGKLAMELVARAGRRGEADDLAGAIDDLRVAEGLGAPPDALAAARLSLADRVAVEIRADLDAGEPGRVAERIEALAKDKIGGPALRRAREVAEAWRTALDEARRGEFGRAHEQLDRAERLAGGTAGPALAGARREIEARQKLASPKVEALYAALAQGRWAETLAAAEAVLEVIAEHPSARQARTRAWQEIAAISPSSATLPGRGGRVIHAGLGVDSPNPPAAAVVPASRPLADFDAPRRPRDMNHIPARALAQTGSPGPRGRFLLWVDTVGGYLVCLDDEVILGRAGTDSDADVPLLGDLSRRHAAVVRDGEGYVVRAIKPTFVNNRPVESAPLKDGDVIRLGSTMELEFHQPSPVSSTARLDVVSRHRLPLAVDGVLLMAETCIVGSSRQAHVPAPGLHNPVVLYRQGAGLCCRATGGFEVDGRACTSRAPLTLQSSVLGEGFSFSLEPLGSRTSPV